MLRLFIVWCWALCACSVAVPRLELPEIVRASQVIVIADVGLATRIGVFADGSQSFETKAAVLRVLKGGEVPSTVIVGFTLPERSDGRVGVRKGTRILFLRKSQVTYEPTDQYWPSLPASRVPPDLSPPTDPLDRVYRELSHVLLDPSVGEDSQLEAIYRSPFIDSRAFCDALMRLAVQSSNNEIVTRSVAALISKNVVEAVSRAVALLQTAALSDAQRAVLLSAVALHLTEGEAIPHLVPLLSSTDTFSRRAAAQALWHIGNAEVVPFARAALDDPDRFVRYYAVRALATATKDEAWGPSESVFFANESQYLSHWH